MKAKIELNGQELIVKKKISKDETYKVNQRKNIFTLAIYKKPVTVTGVTSMCQDGKHVLFLDYDNICKWIVLQDLNKLVGEHTLSPIYLFTTEEEEIEGQIVGNYHAICLQKFTPAQVLVMQRQTHCDRAYMTMPRRNIFRSWVLRTSGKKGRPNPKYLCYIGGVSYKQVSSAHLDLLNKLYPKVIPNLAYSNKDGRKRLFRNVYETGNV